MRSLIRPPCVRRSCHAVCEALRRHAMCCPWLLPSNASCEVLDELGKLSMSVSELQCAPSGNCQFPQLSSEGPLSEWLSMTAPMQCIARRWRGLALRCAHALHMRDDEAEAPDQVTAQQPLCVDLKPTAEKGRPACCLAASGIAPLPAAVPLHLSAAPTQDGTAVAQQACSQLMPINAVHFYHACNLQLLPAPSLFLIW